MAAAARVVQSVARHHLVLEALPEELQGVLWAGALEGVQVLNDHIVIWGPLQF